MKRVEIMILQDPKSFQIEEISILLQLRGESNQQK